MKDSLLQIAINYHHAGHLKEAEEAYRKALSAGARMLDVHFHLGTLLQAQGRLEEAAISYGRALALDRTHAAANYNLGLVYSGQGKFSAAAACFRRTLQTAPDFAEAFNNLGNVLKEQGKLEEAISCYRRALEIKPDYAFALNGLAGALQEQGKLEEAISCYRRALEVKPDYSIAHSNLLLALNYHPGYNAATVFEEHLQFAKQNEKPLNTAVYFHANDPTPGRRLRIGYVSPDFRRHSVGFFIEPVLSCHDHGLFEVFCYSDVAVQDEMTKRMQAHADRWRNINGMSDEQAAGLVLEDGIDILIDLAGHTGYNRMMLFARKPAPVQASWIGYPNTTGMSSMDYRIVDQFTDPNEMTDRFCTEKLVRMPRCFLCYRPDMNSPEVSGPPVAESGSITFGSFNKIAKITPDITALWAAILKAVPNSRLLIKAKGIDESGTRRHILDLFAKEGIDDNKLVLMSREPTMTGHLAAYRHVDIALDTFPYNGTTTTCEALWMGVPVVTMAGNTHVSRVGLSLLSNVGAPELIAYTPEEYVKTAAGLAADTERLKRLRNDARGMLARSPLTNAKLFTADLESSYFGMWKKWCETASAKPLDIDGMLQTALKHHQAGQSKQAEAIYRRVLEKRPEHPDVLHLLGMLAHQKREYDTAEKLISRAIALDNSTPLFYLNLGNVFREQGKSTEAISNYRKALALEPEFAVAHYNLANELLASGNTDDAEAHYRQAVAANPAFLEACLGLAKTHHSQGKSEEAIENYKAAVSLDPQCSEAWFNMGVLLHEQNRFDEAIENYRRALQITPVSAVAYYNIGLAKQGQGRLDEAIEHYRRATEIDPEYVDAYYNIGLAKSLQCKMDEAIENYGRAVELDPKYEKAYYNMGMALMHQNKLEESIKCYKIALQINPEHINALNNLGYALKDQGKLDEAEECYRRALGIQPDSLLSNSNLLLHLNYSGNYDAGTIFMEHQLAGKLLMGKLGPGTTPHTNDRDPSRRLRVGYVSPDFRWHSVGFFIEPVVASHNRDLFEVFCYANLPHADKVTMRMREHADHWRDIESMSDEQAAALIREDGIDILVDLAGHTGYNRIMLFAHKPAPVQASWIGYPNTTGLPAIDYRIVDALTDPPGMTDRFCTEELIRLPGCFLSYQPDIGSPEVNDLPALDSGFITFGSFNYLGKINRDVISLWAAILKAAPKSRLLIKAKGLADNTARSYLSGRFREEGVEAGRIELMGHVPSLTGHMGTYHLVDIALDTFPYNGTTTTCEALWMGVPVVAMEGNTHVSRVGVSLLSNVGVPQLIAKTPGEYINIAVRLADDKDTLKALRHGLRRMILDSRLTNAKRLTRDLEDSYRLMWGKWCASGPVPPSAD